MANYISQVTLPNGTSYNVRELFPHVGNCTDAAATAAKTVTIGNFKLYTGAWVVVKFSNTNSAAVASLTLNVDGTGAKPIKYRNANLSSAGLLIANRYTYFIYDGTNYQIVGDFDTNSDTYDRNRYKANIKAGTSALVAGNIIVGKDGVFNHLKSGGSFDISYPILYLNGAVAAGDTTNNSYDIINFTITTTQSISLTAYLPVFIKGTLSGKIFTPVSAVPLTQTVPTTDDGYQYMYLGNATSTSAVYLTERHPIYAFKNKAFGEIVHTAGNANNIATTVTPGSSSELTNYGVIFAGDPSVSEFNVARKNNDFRIQLQDGTASTAGWASLILGNATSSGTAGNKEGRIVLYSTSTSYHKIIGDATTSIYDHTLPNISGTISMLDKNGTNYWGLVAGNSKTDWVRTTQSGIIPYQNGGAGSGHSSLGTSTWYFSNAYIDTVHGSLDGNAATATTANKLTTARTIAIGTGVTSTATSFDGSANITIPVTGIKEAYLTWGGKDFAGSYGPIDAAIQPRLGANRMEFLKAAGITIERTTDGGTSWTVVDVSATAKTGLFTVPGTTTKVSATSTAETGTAAANNMMRVTVATGAASIYTVLNKFIIYMSTSGCSGCYVKIRIRLESNRSAGNDTWKIWNKSSKTWVATTDASATEANTRVDITGWSGFNVINVSGVTTYGNQAASQYGNVQFIFGCTSNSSTSAGMEIYSIQGYGGVGWTTPSKMAQTGHLYSYDASQNATFPAALTATNFNGKLNTMTISGTNDGSYNLNNFLTEHPTITKSTDTTSTASPAYGGTFTVVDSVTREANGHVTKINTKTVTLPADSNTDEKVKVDLFTSTTATDYMIAGATAAMATTAGHLVIDTADGVASARIRLQKGTTADVGQAMLMLGNNIASGTAKNMQGNILMYATTANYGKITPAALTDTRTWTMPDKTGTVALTSDIPTIPTVNNASLTLKGAGTTVTTFTANASTNQSLDIVAGSNVTITPDATNHKITIASTTYSANNGVGLSGTTFYNSGVRAVSTGSANGTISVNTNGTSADVAVKGLASAAYVTQESLLRARSSVSTDGGATGWSQIGINQYNNAYPDGVTNKIYAWGAVVSIPAPNARFDLYYNHNSSTAGAATNGLQYRTGWDNDKKAWRMLLDSGNYTSYTVTKTGGGASGSWGISITGSAASWTTARTLTLGGQLTGSVSVKGDANMTLSGHLNRAFIYDDNAVPSGHNWDEYAWHKFAEVTITDAWADCIITFLVSRTYGGSAENTGILSAKLRTNESKAYDSAQLKWLVRDSGLSKDDFVMVYTSTSGTSTKAELWCRIPTQYSGLIFTVLKEHRRHYSTDTSWTLVKTPDATGSTHGSSSYPTTGITDKIISSDGTITNSTTGTSSNVTGTVAIAHGGTGATTRLAALRALTEQDVGTSAQYFLTITNSWGKGGYTSVANAKTVLGLKSAAYTESSDYVPNTQEGVIDAINLLSEGLSTPSLADYYVSQFVNGGTTSKSYHRRPISALWDAFKGLITLTTTGSGNAVTAVSIANDGDNNRKITVTKGSTFSLSTHTHGLLHSDLNQASTNGTTGGWSVIGIDPAVTGYVLKSIRVNTTSPDWLSGDYGAGIAFGGSDTKGVISMNYQSPVITFAGGNHNSSKTEPTWYFKISGTSGSTYNLANFNAATATKLATARTINGVSFDGSANITIPRSIKHIHTANGTDGSGGWVKIARITVTEAYADQPMTFTIAQRRIMQYRIHLLFTNSGSAAATAISEFIITRDNSWTDTNNDPRAYIIKPSDGIFDLYIRKTVSWDRIFVVDFTKADDGGGINYSITWENVHVADSAITGGTEAVKKLYLPTTTNYAGSSSVGGAATYVNGTLTNPTDPIEYSVPFHAYPTTGSKSLLNNDGISYVCREGTTGNLGFGVLVLGNGVNSGTAGNKYGIVRMYPQTGKYYGQIRPVTTLTGSRTYQLPDANGNVILGIKDSGFWGLMDGDGSTSGWIRTTTNGLIPVQSGDAGSGHSKLGTSTWYFAAAYIDNIHGNNFEVGKASTIDGEMLFYNSGGSGVTTLKGKAQSTNGTYLLPARGNGSYTLSCGHEDLAAATGSLSAANVTVPSYTKFIKIVFKSDSNPILYSMVEIPYFGNGDYGALVQVGTYGDGQNGSPRIVMKAVIINITDGTQTGKKSFTVTASPTTKINGSSISNFERNITIHKIYAMD